MKSAVAFAAILIAIALQTTIGRLAFGGSSAIDLVLIVVVYIAIKSGPATGLLALLEAEREQPLRLVAR